MNLLFVCADQELQLHFVELKTHSREIHHILTVWDTHNDLVNKKQLNVLSFYK